MNTQPRLLGLLQQHRDRPRAQPGAPIGARRAQTTTASTSIPPATTAQHATLRVGGAARRPRCASAIDRKPRLLASERRGVGVVCAHYHDNLARRRPDNNRGQLAPRRNRDRRVDESASRCLALGAADGLDHAPLAAAGRPPRSRWPPRARRLAALAESASTPRRRPAGRRRRRFRSWSTCSETKTHATAHL